MTNYERIFQELGEIKATGAATLEQAKKTNGRVSTLEAWKEEIDVKAAYQKGFSRGKVAILTALCTAVLFLVAQILVPIIAAYIQK